MTYQRAHGGSLAWIISTLMAILMFRSVTISRSFPFFTKQKLVSDNGPLFSSKEFAKFLSGLGIKHTTSSPGYPHSNGFIEQHIQTVKNMLSFQEVLADLRTTRIGTGLPSPAEILHGRNLTTKAQAEIDINAIRSLLQERQLKMTLAHDSSKRAKKARPLVVGERCYVLGHGMD